MIKITTFFVLLEFEQTVFVKAVKYANKNSKLSFLQNNSNVYNYVKRVLTNTVEMASHLYLFI